MRPAWTEERRAKVIKAIREASVSQTGWPKTPKPEEADDTFVRTVVKAMRAEGLIRPGRAA